MTSPLPPPDAAQLNDWMTVALRLAARAASLGEVPVGAVVVHAGVVIAKAYNRRERDANPLAHAELLALRLAARHLNRWRLTGCTLVVTLEPCPMCAGALVNARVDRLVFGAADARAGAAGSVFQIVDDRRLNHRLEVVAGVQADAAALQLRRFFAVRRAAGRQRLVSGLPFK